MNWSIIISQHLINSWIRAIILMAETPRKERKADNLCFWMQTETCKAVVSPKEVDCECGLARQPDHREHGVLRGYNKLKSGFSTIDW